MRLVPTFDEIADAQHAINAQHPSLSGDPPATTLANETDGNGRRVLRVTTQQLATLVHGLARSTHDFHVGQAKRIRELSRLLERGVRLFERAACDDHRHPPDDHVAPATWQAIAEWQDTATEMLGPDRVNVDPDVCWHCHVCLEPAARHCETCPPEGECDVEACEQPGCVGRSHA